MIDENDPPITEFERQNDFSDRIRRISAWDLATQAMRAGAAPVEHNEIGTGWGDIPGDWNELSDPYFIGIFAEMMTWPRPPKPLPSRPFDSWESDPVTPRPLPLPGPKSSPPRPLPLPPAPSSDEVSVGRFDPYYDGLWWGKTGGVIWTDRARLDAQRAARIMGRIPGWLLEPAAAAEAVALGPRYFETTTAVIRALVDWHTLTVQQLVALTGERFGQRYGTEKLSMTLRLLFAAGAIEVGLVGAAPRLAKRQVDPAALIRLARAGAFRRSLHRRLADMDQGDALEDDAWVARSDDRHDILTVELALRLAERASTRTRIATILPERQSSLHRLAFTDHQWPIADSVFERTADATIVRQDGGRLAVETTANLGQGTQRKLLQWAQAMARRTYTETGLCVLVLFVGSQNGRSTSLGQVRNAIGQAVQAIPGYQADDVRSRFFLAEWRALFPASHTAGLEFDHLRAWRMSDLAGRQWEQCDLLGSHAEFGAKAPDYARNVQELAAEAARHAAVPRPFR